MPSTVNVIIQTALDFAYDQNSLFFQNINRAALEAQLQAALDTVIPKELELDTTTPDFEAIFLKMIEALQTSDAWIDIIPSATGQTLLRNVTSGISYAVFGQEQALRESMVHLANADSSIMEGTRMLGIRPQRRIPSRVNVRLSRPDDGTIVTVPALTQFSIREFDFFLRDQVVFNANDITIDVTLYQGTVLELTGTSESIPYEKIEIGSENNMISDEDVYVYINGEQWERKTIGLYHFERDEKAFYDDTLHNGNVEVCFGNRIFGAIPPADAEVRIVWAETEGVGANFPTFGLQVTQINAQSGIDISGETLSAIYGGGERLLPGFYRAMAPNIRAANKRAVRRSDQRAIALQYPNVVDALFRGQAELNPGKRNWMNILGATILIKPDTPWTNYEWDQFIEYMNARNIYRTEYLRLDPTPVDIAISGKVYCRPSANLDQVKRDLELDVETKLGKRLGALGYSVYRSDIIDILEGADANEEIVEFVKDITPTGDTVLTSLTQYVRVTSVNLEMFYTTRNDYDGRRVLD